MKENDIFMTEASLSDSYMYGKLNKSASITKKIAGAIQNGIKIDKSYIEEQYLQIKKSRISPLADDVLKAFDDGEIKLIFCKQVKIGVSLPFVVVKSKSNPNKAVAYIFISDFATMSRDGKSINIDMKKLYVLMESALIAKEFYTNPSKFQRNSGIAKLTASIYSSMALRILNKEFALSLNKDIYDNINFIIAKFYLTNVFGMLVETSINNYAISTCNNPNRESLLLIDDNYSDANVMDIDMLIKYLSTLSPKMKPLNFRYFFERWLSTYGTGACLSIDAFPYLLFVICNVLLGGFMVNAVTLSDIIKNTKGINTYYSEIVKIMR